MSAEIVETPFCPGCLEAQALICSVESASQHFKQSFGGDELTTLPLLLESALACLLSEFDYEANPGCNLALVASLIATGAAQAESLRARHAHAR